MKRTFLTGSLVVITLVQSIAHADFDDLPDPTGDGGGSTQVTPVTPTTPSHPVQTQYAGTLRLNGLSRKTGGASYKIDLAQAVRLQRLDLRVEANRVKIHSASLITESGNVIAVRLLSGTAVLDTTAAVSSEVLSLNERVKSVELIAESYGGEADVVVTAVSDSAVPKLSLRKEVVTPPVVVTPPMDGGGSVTPISPNDDPYNPQVGNNGGSIVYYGNRFQSNDIVLLACDHDCGNPAKWVGRVLYTDTYGSLAVKIGLDTLNGIDPQDLSKSVNNFNGFTVGDQVASNGLSGSLTRIFDNGMAQVAWVQRGSSLVRLASLRKGNANPRPSYPGVDGVYREGTCLNDDYGNARICVGDTVEYRRGFYVVDAVYQDGAIFIRNPRNGYGMDVDQYDVVSPRDRRRW